MVDSTPRPSAGPRRGWRNFIVNVGLVCATVLAALVVCEVVLRVLGVSYPVLIWMDPVRGVAHIPKAHSTRQYHGKSWISINSAGWRGPEWPLRKAPGSLRIALVGDSYIEAFGVPLEQTAGEVIARRLSAMRHMPVEVLNFGEGGYGTAQEYLALRNDVWRYAPDLVLLGVTPGNDISDNSRVLKKIDYVPYFVFRGDSLVVDSSFRQAPGYRSRGLWTHRFLLVVRYSRVAQLVNRVRHLGRRVERNEANAEANPAEEVGMRDEVELPPQTAAWKEAWRVTEGLLSLMHQDCQRHQTPFAIVTLTRGIQVTPDRRKKARFLEELGAPDAYYPERRLAEFGRREGVPVLNLAPTMARQAEEQQVYYHAENGVRGVGHWNEAGHEAAGELIASWLGNGLLDSLLQSGARRAP
jgi:hypothetical protein